MVEVKVAVATVVAVAMAMAAVVMAEVAKWASAQMVKGLKAGTQAVFLAAHEEEARMEVSRGHCWHRWWHKRVWRMPG